jgi:hypothetical protein
VRKQVSADRTTGHCQKGNTKCKVDGETTKVAEDEGSFAGMDGPQDWRDLVGCREIAAVGQGQHFGSIGPLSSYLFYTESHSQSKHLKYSHSLAVGAEHMIHHIIVV